MGGINSVVIEVEGIWGLQTERFYMLVEQEEIFKIY